MFAAKLAILLQIKRIFSTSHRDFIHWAVQVLISTNFLVYLALFFAFIFACLPREKIWNPHIPGKCIDTNASIIATSAINIVSDLTILFLPLLSIARLHLPLGKKIGVATVFATGTLWVALLGHLVLDLLTILSACIASIIRLIYSVRLTKTEDITWAIAPVGMWA
jgi:hypothetical protein